MNTRPFPPPFPPFLSPLPPTSLRNWASALLVLLVYGSCLPPSDAQPEATATPSGSLHFRINETLTNTEEPYFVEITSRWRDYLESEQYVRTDSEFWNYDRMPRPDYSYIQLLLELRSSLRNGERIDCNIIGLIPVVEDHYLLKCLFTRPDPKTGAPQLRNQTSVYAQADTYQFVNSTQYHQRVWEQRQVGTIRYSIHPEHRFDSTQAKRMAAFNQRMAEYFDTEAIAFDYVVANNTTQLNQLLGYDYNPYSYQPVQTGGLTDNYNRIIYAGNNSAYYPHEVVHLYTYRGFAGQYHAWVDEGIAAYFGGSTGYELAWHLQKLKVFLAAHPDYEIRERAALQKNIPNGEYTTDFRYAIGGLLIQKIYEREGMPGLFEALRYGRSDADYFRLLEDKLQVAPADFGAYVKREVAQLQTLTPAEMDRLKY